MKRSSIWLLITMVTISITAVVAFAASVHLKHKPPLTFTDNTGPAPSTNLTLTASGALAGLGNGDVVVTLTAQANPTGQCCNPGGQCKVPGQNPAPVEVTGAQAIPEGEIKNGNVSFDVDTSPPQSPILGAPDCPNTSWTETIIDLVFTQATITVYQPAVLDCTSGTCVPVDPDTGAPAQVVFSITCTLSGVDGVLTSSCP
jgi:hypothetical protein